MLYQIPVVFIDVDQHIVGNGDNPFARIAVDSSERADLFHIHVVQSGQFCENPLGCIVYAFAFLNKSAH